jgi:hypothetical protein
MREDIIKMLHIQAMLPEHQAECIALIDLFPPEQLAEVATILKEITQTNVGAGQSRQALLIMAHGDIERLRQFFEKWKIYDPRDFLLMAWEEDDRRKKSKPDPI